MLSGFWLLRKIGVGEEGGGGGEGGWVLSESVKKGKFVTKIFFFSDNVE